MSTTPNVLCISMDSVRADDVSFLSQKNDTTPHLNELGSRSAVYEKAISPSTWTLPVHASFFTGKYPLEHGILDGGRELGSEKTLGEQFNEAGYQTEAFYRNSWFEFGEILRGFSVQRDSSSSGPDMSGWRSYIKKGLKKASIDELAYKLYLYQQRPHEDETTVERAIERLNKVGEPFLFFVHLNDAHYQYHPPKSLENRFSSASKRSLRWNQLYWQNRIFENKEQYWAGNWSPKSGISDRMRELYRAEILKVDQLINDLTDALKSNNQFENTIIVVFGDHGDNFGEDGIYGHHFSVADSLIRVPLLVYDPTNQIESGRKEEIVQLNDIYSTLLSLCGIDDSATTSSIDFSQRSRDTAYTYYHIVEDTHLLPMIKNVNEQSVPPKRQYTAWQSAKKRATWYPDTNTSDGDEEMVTKIKQHHQSLEPSDTVEGGPIEGKAKEQLKRLGYL